MDFINVLAAEAPQLTNIIAKFLNVLYESIGNFGWAVVVFGIIVRAILSPLDIWSKLAMRKQSKAMARLQPQLAKLQKQYANRPDILRVKQAELYKKEKISFFASCIPMIVTMVLFFIVFSGFTAMVKYKNEMILFELNQAYMQSVAAGNPLNAEQLAALYQPESWLWVKNVFMPDSWSSIIPDLEKFVGTGIGGIGATMPESISIANPYDTLVGPAMSQYNGTRWNGFLILPLLSIATTILSTKFMQASTPPTTQPTADGQTEKMQKTTNKVMLIFMPIMIGVFSLFYSAAFSLYLFVSNLFSSTINIIFNIVTKRKDKKQLEAELKTTFK